MLLHLSRRGFAYFHQLQCWGTAPGLLFHSVGSGYLIWRVAIPPQSNSSISPGDPQLVGSAPPPILDKRASPSTSLLWLMALPFSLMASPLSLMASSIFYPPSTDHKPPSAHHKPCMFSHNQRISSAFSTLIWLLVALLLCSSPHLAWVHTSIPSSPQLTHLACSEWFFQTIPWEMSVSSPSICHQKLLFLYHNCLVHPITVPMWCLSPLPMSKPTLRKFANSFILMGESDY